MGVFNEIGHMKVQVDNVKNKATFTATSVFVLAEGGVVNNSVGDVATCKYTFERTDALDPIVPPCATLKQNKSKFILKASK